MDKDYKTLVSRYATVVRWDPIFSTTVITSKHILNGRKVAMLTAMRSLKEKRIEVELKKPFCEALWNMYGRGYQTTWVEFWLKGL